VRVAGVKVGTIDSIQPDGTQTKMTLHVDHGVPIPADATAVIVAQNLIAARYVQLAPAYGDSGPTMTDGAVIPIERTAIPVEWDEVKEQLTRLATELGPRSDVSVTSVSAFIDSAADALGGGNSLKLRRALTQLSEAGRILSDGSGNLVDIIKNLQTFITTLRDSNQQIVEFQGRLATLTSVLDASRSDLDGALRSISDVVGEVQRFISGTRDQTVEQVQRLANVTQNLVDHRKDLEQVLHVAPTAFANSYNIFDPRTGGAGGVFALKNFSNAAAFICTEIGALENVTAPETGKLCDLYLGPALRRLNFNYLPFPVNPLLTAVPRDSDLLYSEPQLAPGGAGPTPGPPELPPAVSAYTGMGGDVPPPPGYVPLSPPGSVPLPPPTPVRGLPDLLLPSGAGPLPAEAPPPAEAAPSTRPQSPEGKPPS